MIELSNTAAQTIPVGGSVTFDRVLLNSGNRECYNRMIPTSVRLRGKGIFDIEFHGNVTSDTAGAAVQLSVAVGGAPIVQTTMNATITAANDIENVSAGTFLRNCCCDNLDRISVINTGTVPVTLNANSSLRISHFN